jgi:low affinity Fe/Cu permease
VLEITYRYIYVILLQSLTRFYARRIIALLGDARNLMGEKHMTAVQMFTAASNNVARGAGSPMTFAVCCLIVIVWAASGPFFGYSDTWQLIINTGTTVVTFLMVFLIQSTQNRDGAAIQAKLDELIRSTSGAQNAFIGIEHLTQKEVDEFRDLCAKRAAAATAGDEAVSRANEKASQAAHAATH